MSGGRLAQRLTDAILSLTAALTAVNDSTQQASANTGALAAGAIDVVITWPKPWPDATYGVYVELATGAAALGSVHATIKTKTANDVTITVANTAAVGNVVVAVFGVRK